MDNETINILIASDINYAPYYGVMLTSLFGCHEDESFNVFLLTDKTWTDAETERFECLCAKHHSRFYVQIVDAEKLRNFPKSGHINLATYYNLNAANLLPSTIHRVIYMDGDMIVNGDIRPLWELDLKGNVCAMVPNCTYFDQSFYDRLGYESKWGYYNNGTTVYDLDYLREMNFADKAMRLIEESPEKIKWMDQDAQNILLHEKILSLPFEYNFQTLFFDACKWDTYTESFKHEILSAAERPVVVHYNGWLKPWHYRYYKMPYGKMWKDVCRKSAWSDAPIKTPIVDYAKHLIKRVIKPRELMRFRNKEFIKESLRFS